MLGQTFGGNVQRPAPLRGGRLWISKTLYLAISIGIPTSFVSLVKSERNGKLVLAKEPFEKMKLFGSKICSGTRGQCGLRRLTSALTVLRE